MKEENKKLIFKCVETIMELIENAMYEINNQNYSYQDIASDKLKTLDIIFKLSQIPREKSEYEKILKTAIEFAELRFLRLQRTERMVMKNIIKYKKNFHRMELEPKVEILH